MNIPFDKLARSIPNHQRTELSAARAMQPCENYPFFLIEGKPVAFSPENFLALAHDFAARQHTVRAIVDGMFKRGDVSEIYTNAKLLVSLDLVDADEINRRLESIDRRDARYGDG